MKDWSQIYRELNTLSWVILLILSSASYFFMSHSTTLGIILGGGIIIVNFGFLQATIRKAFQKEELAKTRKALLIVKSFFRIFLLGVIIYLLITRGLVDPVGLTVGLSVVVFSIVSFGIRNACKSGIKGAM